MRARVLGRMDSTRCVVSSLNLTTSTCKYPQLQYQVNCLHAVSFWDGSMGQQSAEVCSTEVHQVQDTQTLVLLMLATSAANVQLYPTGEPAAPDVTALNCKRIRMASSEG